MTSPIPDANADADAAGGRRPRVLHFVTGGFSGATQVALDLVEAHLASHHFEPLLVLRRKRNTQPERVQALIERGVPVEVVPGWSHAATVWRLRQICRAFRPDILVAHGYSDHIWARYAGLLAGVPHLVHVEHSARERYSRWRLAQALWLARRTDLTIGCSEGVRQALLERGFPPATTLAIPNGIRLAPFQQADQHPYADRLPGIVMAARFARQKDHATLLRALAILRQRDLHPPLSLAGGGKNSHRRAMQTLAKQLGLAEQVQFLGHCGDMPGLLMSHQLCVLSTHYEGMPLALVEGMAAGCLPIGSQVVGVRELIDSGHDGLLVPEGNAQALADALEQALRHPADSARLAARARQAALDRHSLALMTARYEQAFAALLQPGVNAPAGLK